MAKKKESKVEITDSQTGREILTALLNKAEHCTFDEEIPQSLPDPDLIPTIDKELTKHPRNDLGNSRRLLARYGQDIKFVRGHGWYGWTGTHWSLDKGESLVRIYDHSEPAGWAYGFAFGRGYKQGRIQPEETNPARSTGRYPRPYGRARSRRR